MSAADGFEGPRRKVLVTGAAGRTGSLVFKKLQAKPGTWVFVGWVELGLCDMPIGPSDRLDR